jgi:hypothetical protein
MGQHSDDALNDAIDHEAQFQSYMDGHINKDEAYDLGLIDELGASPDELVNSRLNPGIMDVRALENDLALCDGALNGSEACIDKLMGTAFGSGRMKPVKDDTSQYWRSGTTLMLPKDMTDNHLKNAIAYAKHHNMRDVVVDEMISELDRRQC